VSHVRVVLFTRYPTPGEAKTRLIPALGAEQAAALHRRLTARTVATVRAAGLPLEVRRTGAIVRAFSDWLGADAAVVDQGDGDLGERLRRAAEALPVILIGADAPDLTADHLRDAADLLHTQPAVIGPAEDGGYWLLGLATPCDRLFHDMPWGTNQVFVKTTDRLMEAGLAPALLPRLADLDRPEDIARWPELLG